MKAYVISDNIDTLVGFNIVGIKGSVIHEKQEALNEINNILKDEQIGIVIITEKISMLIDDKIRKLKLSNNIPLIVEIPDRHGTMKGKNEILKYVKESIGLKI